MGTWGVEIFEDDIAADIRDQYTDLLDEGIGEPQASQKIIGNWKKDLDDQDIYPVFWLALAAVQIENQCLSTTVSKEAMKIIEEGTDLVRWEEDKDLLKQRKQVLGNFKNILKSYDPKTKKKKPSRKKKVEIKTGDVISIPLSDGRKCYGQYVQIDNSGSIIKIFSYFTSSTEEFNVDEMFKSKLLFPPVYFNSYIAVDDGRFQVVGYATVKRFKYPKFLWGVRGKNWEEIASWSLYNRKQRKLIGPTLPKKYWKYELIHNWLPDELIKRIETGVNPREKLYKPS